MSIRRNRRGVSVVESLVAMVLTGGLIATGTSLLVFFSTEAVEVNRLAALAALNKSVRHTVAPALEGMVFRPQFGVGIPNGPVNATFQQTTVSARWQWRNDPIHMAQLYPGLVGLQQSSGICLQDRNTFLTFEKDAKTISLDYFRRQEGRLVACLGGSSAERDHIGPITWNKVADAQLVKLGDTHLSFWIRFEGEQEWHWMDGGLLED